MGNTPSFNDPFGRTRNPGPGPYVLAPDRFKEKADRDAAKRGAQPRDAFAGKGGAKTAAACYDPFAAKPKAEVRAAAMKPATAQKQPKQNTPQRTLANGAALQVVASQPEIMPVQRLEREEVKRVRSAGKASSLVLVSTAGAMTAMAEPVASGAGGSGDLVMPRVEQPAPKPVARSGGGGGGARPPRDRILNQDDLVGVLIVIAMLLLLALYLFRGGGGGQTAPIDNKIVSTQFAATTPAAPPQPLADPFGDKPVDLTPKSPLPPEPAATPPPPLGDITMHAWFCTAKAELTPQTMAALDKQVASWKSELATKQLVVAGYADTRGSSDYNVSLSSARATAVADYLKAKGVKVASESGVGELSGLADNENCSNQRRVDVRLSDGKDAPPDRSCAPAKEVADLACS